MSGSFLRHGGIRARDLLWRNRALIGPAVTRPSAQRPRAFTRSIPAASNFSRGSSSHLSPAASALVSSAAAAASSAASRMGFVSWYLGMIETRPIITKGLTAGAIFTIADLSSQMCTLSASDSLDWIRTLRMASYGMLLSGPSLHIWFNFVSRILPKRDIISTLKKIFLGQTTYGPFMTAVFFSVNAGLQGETAAEILARLKRDVIPTCLTGLVYWPMCDFVTFKFIAVRLQPLVNNSFAFLWTIYITYMASLQKAPVHYVATN